MKMIFDVESNGLHGEGFAVGWVLLDENGNEIANGYEACPPEGHVDPWVEENVLPRLPGTTQDTANAVRSAFWQAWMTAKSQGATLWADCGWPVEANFLSACVADSSSRQWEGPYPLHEIASIFEAAGWDAAAKHERLENETAHHPTGDARQSARLLRKALQELTTQV